MLIDTIHDLARRIAACDDEGAGWVVVDSSGLGIKETMDTILARVQVKF